MDTEECTRINNTCEVSIADMPLGSSSSQEVPITMQPLASMEASQVPNEVNLNLAETLTMESVEYPGKHYCLKEGMKLRDYQMELADPGINGRNYVLVAPTGTGKTLVAAYIIMHHLKHLKEDCRKGKVAFMTPTRQLAHQQKIKLEDYISGVVVKSITGEGGSMQPLIQSDAIDVMVCTAGKLRKELITKQVSISDFSLIIVDECHHAGYNNSNYADVMGFHIKMKHNQTIDQVHHLPQVVGMTASPGAGKKKIASLETAVEHQESLCACLDATSGIVTVKRNLEELKRFFNDPVSHFEKQQQRSPDDMFIEHMNSAMKKLEVSIRIVSQFSRGSQQYESWLQTQREDAEKCQENKAEEIAVLNRLSVYSRSLMTYSDFRYEDAILVLNEIQVYQDPSEFEVTLDKDHKILIGKLAEIQRMPNPILEHVESIIMKHYSKFQDSKGIFFVCGIKHTKYVTEWIKSSPCLSKIIRVAPITGNCSGGMDKAEQYRILEGFHNGTYNLLASTSVLEEGLDVPKCNFIVRYQNVSNEIAQVQAKGRARDQDSRFYTVVSANSNREYWYLVQEEKQHIVNNAIGELQQCNLEPIIIEKQKQLILRRNLRAEKMKMRRNQWPNAENVEIRCKSCKVVACKGSEVFFYTLTGEDPHYVVPNKAFHMKYRKSAHDKPEELEDFVKPYRMFCNSKTCRNKWGIVAMWKDTGFKFPVLKCESFVFWYKKDDGTIMKVFF